MHLGGVLSNLMHNRFKHFIAMNINYFIYNFVHICHVMITHATNVFFLPDVAAVYLLNPLVGKLSENREKCVSPFTDPKVTSADSLFCLLNNQ